MTSVICEIKGGVALMHGANRKEVVLNYKSN